ncbi:MAG: BREX-6 system BrxE protein [Nostoc sp.]|uniref:BREX-6 system BrxE protein n=1 Tax=Nostoc sp. TaxID=1180 RepID=UPI002FFA4233
MSLSKVNKDTLDKILALQIIVAWAGEGACEPKRLDWWRTDLIDENGGGDLFQRLFPKTYLWASLEAVRQAAIHKDRGRRMDMAKPDAVRTLFFWGFSINEQLAARLIFHKQNGINPLETLPFQLDIYQAFSKPHFEEAISIPHGKVNFKLVPSGREIVDETLKALDECAKRLASALLPFSDKYPMPFYRLEER